MTRMDATTYDAMVNWEARRTREMPFYRRLFEGKPRLLDVACGTGHHAIWLAQEGWAVEGCDLSAAMLDAARAHDESAAVTWFEADMERLPTERGPYDGVLCLGNALSLLTTRTALGGFFQGAAAILRPGGTLLFQILNYQRLQAEPLQWAPVRSGRLDGQEALFVKRIDLDVAPDPEGVRVGRIELLVMWREDGAWRSRANGGRMAVWLQPDLQTALDAAGFTEIAWYGDHLESAFAADGSQDLIGVARRRA